jgi:anthranilate synthase/phosphoribosyltransferase
MTILMLDNFDSFTYNLVDFFRQLGCEVKVYRNTVEPETLEQIPFDLLVLSPGPSVPAQAGNMMAIIQKFYREKPILGVCLGHQALIEFFGGTLANVAPVHGKAVKIRHDSKGVFSNIEQDCEVARYHSWAGDLIPAELEVTARSSDGVIMGIRHKRLPIEGIQFHPESVLTMKNQVGMRMLRNVVEGKMASGNLIYHEFSQILQSGSPIPHQILRAFLFALDDDQLSDDQKQILLVSLSHRLRDAAPLVDFIGILMAFKAKEAVLAPGIASPVDICGTGGSGLPRINTSTLTALLLAQCGLPIAKHGNRAAAGRYGSFNLLENLGIAPAFEPSQAAVTLENANIAFVFAPDVHPVFRHFAAIRSKIGVPTIFNALGPLINPYLPERQFIGTSFADLMEVIFETGIKMGKKHLLVVRAEDGLDEISLSGPTRVLEYRNGIRTDYHLHPQDFGLEPIPFEALSAANPAACLKIAQEIIAGKPVSVHYKLIAANAAFIYTRFVEDIPLTDAYQKMENLIREGVMQNTLQQYQAALTAAHNPAEL